MTNSPHYHGHRERLRERFARGGLGGLSDYEAVELMLSVAIPRRDVKPAAKALLARFGNLRGILDAPASELQQVEGIGEGTAVVLRLLRELAMLYQQQSLVAREPLATGEALRRLWSGRLGALRHEMVEVAYLDSGLRLLNDGIETLEQGSVSWAAIYPRRIVEAALRRGAAAIVLAHNHPGGTPEPSQEDVRITLRVRDAAAAVEVRLIDHFIVAGDRVVSFVERRLL